MPSGGTQIERLYSTIAVDLSELRSGLASAQSETRAATQGMSSSFETASRKIDTSLITVTKSAGAQRMGMQQLSYQLSDVAQGFAMGVSPMRIFVQQGGQVVQALGLMSGGARGLIGLLGNPWVMMGATAAAALIPLIANLYDTSSALQDVRADARDAIEALNALGGASIDVKIAKATGELTRLQEEQTRLQGRLDNPALMFTHGMDRKKLFETNQQILNVQNAINQGGRRNREDAEKEAEKERKKSEAEARKADAAARRASRAGAAAANRAQREAEQEAKAQARAEEQFLREKERANIGLLSAQASLTYTLEGEVQIQERILEAREAAAIREIENEERWSRAKKDELIALERQTASYERDAIRRDAASRASEHMAEMNELQVSGARDLLAQQMDFAATAAERRKIALELVELDYQLARIKLEEVVSSGTANEYEKERAAILLKQLDAMKAGQIEAVKRANINILSPEGIGQELGYTLERGVMDALRGRNLKDAMRDGMVDLFYNSMSEAFRSLSNIAFGEQGVGGLLGGLFSSLFGGKSRAAGGPVLAGAAYNVGVGEKFVPSQTGRVLSRQDAMAAISNGGVTVVQHNNFAGGAVTQEDLARMAAVTRQSAIQGVFEAQGRKG